MKYKFILPAFILFAFIACNHINKRTKNNMEATVTESKDELWKQYMKVEFVSKEKMPPDSNSFVILNHKKVSYYRFNKLEFTDDLIEYLINDSLIVYKLHSQPDVQIGYNRKDSLIILTKGHPEGGLPTGNMEFYARKVEAASPFK
ncbi:MAG: hypothetical protein ACKVQB_04480 [Bacteroidia bacterium]